MSPQVGRSDERLVTPVARVSLEHLVDLDYVPVEDVAEGEGPVALVALELVHVRYGHYQVFK